MSRLLLTLAVAQTAALAFVAVKLLDTETRLDALQQAIAATPGAPAAAATIVAGGASVDLSALRRIIREELAVAPRGQPATAPVASAPAPSGAAVTAATSQVRQQLSSYVARGRMSAAEMDAFLADAAELPTEQRRQVMRELTKAMNSGKLDARM